MDKELGDRIERLFSLRHSHRKTFFGRRVKARDEIADLTQEAFLRVLRADSSQAIHNPEAYLFAVAGNLVREYSVTRVADRTRLDTLAPVDVLSVKSLSSFGSTELAQTIATAAPSINFPRPEVY